VNSIEKNENQYICKLQNGEEIFTDKVLYATGRMPNTNGLNLNAIGIEEAENGAIKVNDYFQTSVPNIYAIGDVIDRIQLTPVALAEGMAVAKNLFKGESKKVDYTNIPTTVFSQPSIGTVGLTEEEARDKYDEIAIYLNDTKSLKHTLSGSNERSLLKLIVDKVSDRLIGFHMVGSDAGEITQGIGIDQSSIGFNNRYSSNHG
jgi:glutathione reductase (NADPH)